MVEDQNESEKEASLQNCVIILQNEVQSLQLKVQQLQGKMNQILSERLHIDPFSKSRKNGMDLKNIMITQIDLEDIIFTMKEDILQQQKLIKKLCEHNILDRANQKSKNDLILKN